MSFLSSRKSSKSGRSGSGSNNRSRTSPSEPGRSSRESSNPSSADNGDDGGGWNEWEWSNQYQREYRSREGPDGKWEYQYRQPNPGDNTPRSSYVGAGDSLATIGEDEVGEPGFTHSPQPPSDLRPSPSLHRSVPYSPTDEHDSNYGYDTASRPIPINRNPGGLQRTVNYQQDVRSSYRTGIPAMSNSTDVLLQRSSRHQDTGEEGDYSDDDTVDAPAEELAGLQILGGSRTVGGSSYSQRSMVDDEGIPIQYPNSLLNAQEEEDAYNDDDDDDDDSDDTAATADPTSYTYSLSPRAPAPPIPKSYPQSENYGFPYAPSAPTSSEPPVTVGSPSSEQTDTRKSTHIAAIATVDEESVSRQGTPLYGSFKVHHANEFEFGRIFKILWTEPMGENRRAMGTERLPTIHKENSYASIRRFLIFRRMDGHCLCLPILTYRRQATDKPGAKPQDHAIIYTEKKGAKGQKSEKPKGTERERGHLKKAIRMEPRTQRDQLDPTSRLNYAKIYTVEYNVKVCFIGRIAQESIKYFNRDYNLVHKPLPQAETEYSDDNQCLEDLGEREPEPPNLDERRVSEPSRSHRGEQREQQSREQHSRKKKGRK